LQYLGNIDFYDLSAIRRWDQRQGIYWLWWNAQPFATWTVENPDASATVYNRLRLTNTRGQTQTIYQYLWDDAEGSWSLDKGNGAQIFTRTEETSGADRIVIETVKNAEGVTASKTSTTWRSFEWGEKIVGQTVDPDLFSLTTSYEYYDGTGQNGYSLLKSRVDPNGSWVAYQYDEEGRKIVESRAWLDTSLGAEPTETIAVYYDYQPLDQTDSNLPHDSASPRQVVEKTLGIVTKKTFYLYREDEESGERTEIEQKATRADAAFNDDDNLTTITVLNPHTFTTADSGKTKSVSYPDGRMTSYEYEYGVYSASGSRPGSFVPSPAGRDIRTIATHGTVSSPAGISLKTTREVIVTSALGNTMLVETQVYTADGYERINWTVHQHDDMNRVTDIYHSDGTHVETQWGCCNKISETDSQGIVTHYTEYDSLQRLRRRVKQGDERVNDISTGYTLDAMGRRLTTTISGDSESLITEAVYDTAGRLRTSTDEAGRVTEYRYSGDNLIKTTDYPGGAEEIQTSYRDGKLKSVNGSAVVSQYYTYGVNQDGSRWTTVHQGGPSSPRWEKTTVDLLGRTISVEKPGFEGLELTTFIHDSRGLLIKTITPGIAPTLNVYDELGNLVMSGLDVDGNELLEPASLDRITVVDTSYSYQDQQWWRRTESKVYAENGSDTQIIMSVRRDQLTGLGEGGLTARNVVEDGHGNQTITETYINRGEKIRTTSITAADATHSAETTTANGLLVSSRTKEGIQTTYGYDDLGRRISQTDPRTGTTSIHYDGSNQMDYREDSANNRTSYEYDPATGRLSAEINAAGKATRYDYNDRGQMTHQYGEVPYPVRFVYNDYGEKIEQQTFRSGEEWAAESWPAGATGPADTTVYEYHEPTGLLASVTDAGGKATRYTYHPGGRMQSRTWARPGAAGDIETTYSYDAATGEMLGIDYSDDTTDIGYAYYRHGGLQSVQDDVGARIFGYTDALQQETETISGIYLRTITHAFAHEGMVGRNEGFTVDTGYRVDYGYHPDTGRLNEVSWTVDGQTGTATYQPHADSEVRGALASGDLLTSYGYEPQRDLLTTVENRQGGQVISRYEYRYDELGRRTEREAAGPHAPAGLTAFEYNDRNELLFAGKEGVRGSPSNAITYESNELNQYTTITGTERQLSPSYDEDGNLIELDGTSYAYDAENRLIVVAPVSPTEGDKRLSFRYDYKGRRVMKEVERYQSSAFVADSTSYFVYNGWNLVEEIVSTAGQPVEHHYYVWGLDLSDTLQGAGGVGGLLATIRDDSVYHYLYDANGNVMQLVNTAGPDDLTAADNPFRFSTKYFDEESGLYYYGYRYYSPGLGRWMNRDPIGGVEYVNLESQFLEPNIYGFTNNDPVNGSDTLGLYTLNYAITSSCNKRCSGSRSSKRACIALCSRNITGEEVFSEWYQLELTNYGFWYGLPKCPKRLCMKDGRPANPDSASWKDPSSPSSAELNLHPGTVWSMRSRAYGPATQCTYSEAKNGYAELIRTRPGAGTVDLKTPGFPPHFKHDVEPIYLADLLENGGLGRRIPSLLSVIRGNAPLSGNDGQFILLYYYVRPLHAE
jgi:RHS repeat-associated protein